VKNILEAFTSYRDVGLLVIKKFHWKFFGTCVCTKHRCVYRPDIVVCYFVPGRSAKCCDEYVSVSVCLSVSFSSHPHG